MNVVYEATERQAAFHAAPEKFKLYGGAMGGGKTVALCAEAIALSWDYPGNRGYLCRHELTSLRKTTLPMLERMLDKAGLIEKHHQTENYFALPNGSIIYYGGLGDDIKAIDRLKSMELGWFGIDEASETTEKFFLMLASRLRLKLPGIRYFGLMASNPDPGWLKARFIDSKQPDHIFVPALPKDNPHLPADYVSGLMALFPEDWSARFINGDWSAFEGTNNVFPYDAIRRAIDREMSEGQTRELGVDVARMGDDETVIAVAAGPVARIVGTYHRQDTMTTTGRVVQAIQSEKPRLTKVDADGVGGGVVDRLRELRQNISEIHGGGKARNTERFANRKAEIYWKFRERLVADDVKLPDDQVLTAQLSSCTYAIRSSGQIEITSKEDMKKKGVKSPDRAEAVIYAFAEGDGIQVWSLRDATA